MFDIDMKFKTSIFQFWYYYFKHGARIIEFARLKFEVNPSMTD